jgi:hypothetical protein
VGAIHSAFSIATSATFSIGIVTSLLAAVVVFIWMPGGRMGAEVESSAPASAPKLEPAAD